MTFGEHLNELQRTKKFRILNNMTAVLEGEMGDLKELLQEEELYNKVCNGIILDGIITPQLIDLTASTSIDLIIAKAKTPLTIPPHLNIFTESTINKTYSMNSDNLKNLEEERGKSDKELYDKWSNIAKDKEEHLDYDVAIELYEKIGEPKEAARVRKLKAEQGAVKVTQKVVHGDEVTKTEIKDSVLNRSNIGGGSSKMQELKDLAEMKKEGLISDEEYEKMKQEIIG
jgi:hypothetical protein